MAYSKADIQKAIQQYKSQQTTVQPEKQPDIDSDTVKSAIAQYKKDNNITAEPVKASRIVSPSSGNGKRYQYADELETPKATIHPVTTQKQTGTDYLTAAAEATNKVNTAANKKAVAEADRDAMAMLGFDITAEKERVKTATEEKTAADDALEAVNKPLTDMKAEYKQLAKDLNGAQTVSMRKAATERMAALEAEAKQKYGTNLSKTGVELTLGAALRETGAAFTDAAGTAIDFLSADRGTPIVNNSMVNFVVEDRDSTLAPEAQKAAEKLHDTADELSGTAEEKKTAAKAGKSAAEQVLIDVGIAAVPLALDIAANTAAPGAGMTAMGIRAFGSGAQEARNAGANVDQATAYGLASAAVEALTEKMSDGLSLAYGKGAADKMTDYVIGKLASSEAGQKAWKLVIGALGEGAEEGVSDLLNPIISQIYKGKLDGVKGYANELDAEQIAYDMFIGAVLGFFGGAGEIAQTTDPTAQYFRDAAQQGKSFKQACADYAAEVNTAAPAKVAETETAPESAAQPLTETAKAEQQNPFVQNAEASRTAENAPQQTQTVAPSADTAQQTVQPNDAAGNAIDYTENPVTDEQGYTGREVKTQNKQFTDVLGQEQTSHVQHKDFEVDLKANELLDSGTTDEVITKLENVEAWRDTETDAAGILAERLVNELNTSPDAAGVAEQLARLRKVLESKVGDAARTLRQRKRKASTVADFVSDAAETLYGEDVDLKGNFSDSAKATVVKTVKDYAERFVALRDGDTDGLKQLILDMSETRNTTRNGSKLIGKAIDRIAQTDGGEAFLKSIAEVQLRSIASDYINPGIINQLKAIRYMNMLSLPATVSRNLGANTVFGNFIAAAANNIAIPLDAAIGKITGNGRTIAFDRGMFSNAFINGASDAALKSFVEVTLDAESSQAGSKYNEIKGRTFKKTGNWFERYLSTIEQIQGYTLKSTDQLQKGGTVAELTRGLSKNAKADGASILANAAEEAKVRTLQQESKAAEALQGIRRSLNEVAHIGNEQTGTYGLGDKLAPFAQVPANSALSVAEQNPVVAGVNAFYTVAKAATQKGKISAEQQAKMVRSVGRGINGIALAAGAFGLAAKGLIRDSDDDDKDVSALEKAMGKTGMQWNVSATVRLANGESAEWRDGDKTLSLGWLPQLNSALVMGASLYDAYSTDGTINAADMAGASWDGISQAFMDFPAVSSITSLINAYKYSEAETGYGKAADVAAQALGDDISSFLVPNLVAGVAKGTDSTERDVYAADGTLNEIVNEIKGEIPGLRQTLPAKTDNFGNEIANEGGLQNFLNRVFNPGQLTTVKSSKAADAVLEIYEKTGKATVIPDRNAPNSLDIGGKSYDLTAEQKNSYKRAYGQTAEKLIEKLLTDASFKSMTDEEKCEAISSAYSYAKSEAAKQYAKSVGVSYTSDYTTLLSGVDKPGTANDRTALYRNNLAAYIAFKTSYGSSTDDADYSGIDALLRSYEKLNSNTQAVLSERLSGFNPLYEAYKAGAVSKDYYTVKDAISAEMKAQDKASANDELRLDAILKANVSSEAARNALAKTMLGKKAYAEYCERKGLSGN